MYLLLSSFQCGLALLRAASRSFTLFRGSGCRHRSSSFCSCQVMRPTVLNFQLTEAIHDYLQLHSALIAASIVYVMKWSRPPWPAWPLHDIISNWFKKKLNFSLTEAIHHFFWLNSIWYTENSIIPWPLHDIISNLVEEMKWFAHKGDWWFFMTTFNVYFGLNCLCHEVVTAWSRRDPWPLHDTYKLVKKLGFLSHKGNFSRVFQAREPSFYQIKPTLSNQSQVAFHISQCYFSYIFS